MAAKSNELKLTRVYDFPVKAVWDAWTDPKKAAKWWGPRGFTITTHSKDLKPGGHWHYTMHGPDGTDYPNRTHYFVVEEFKRLVYDHGANENQPPLFRVTVNFKDLGGKTEMEMTMTFATADVAQHMKGFIKQANGNSTWDRLAEYLDEKNDTFVINRSFEAPIEQVFEMWVNPKHVAKWMGPAGTSLEYFQSEIGEGKTTFYKMTYDTGMAMYGKMTYLKIQKPDYLEYTQQFCDESGNMSRHPMVPVWPEVMRTSVKFTREEANHTRVTLTWQAHGKATPEEIRAFIEMKAGMNQGWGQSFDRLEEYIAAK